MTEQTKGFTEFVKDPAADAVALLTHYSFDLSQHTATALVDKWLIEYKPGWIRYAVIEALYQGRYKAISVEQILALWQRRGQTLHHFNHEFERLVCNKLPRSLTQPAGIESHEDLHNAAIATFLKRLHQDITRSPETNIAEDGLASSRSLPPTELSDTTSQPLKSESPPKPVDDSGGADLNELPPSAPPQPDETITSPTTIATPEEVNSLPAATHRSPALFPTPSEAAEIVVDDTPILRPNPERSSTAVFMPEVKKASEKSPGTSELEGSTPDATDETSESVASSTSITDFTATEISQSDSVETTTLASVQSINQFTPISESSEFHAKLRAVAHVDELRS